MHHPGEDSLGLGHGFPTGEVRAHSMARPGKWCIVRHGVGELRPLLRKLGDGALCMLRIVLLLATLGGGLLSNFLLRHRHSLRKVWIIRCIE